TVYRALQQASRRIVDDVALRRALGMGPHLDWILELDREHGYESLLVRLDGFIGTDGRQRIIECNSLEPGAAQVFEAAFATLPITQDITARHPLRPLESYAYAGNAVRADLARRGLSATPTVAMLDAVEGADTLWLPHTALQEGWRLLHVDAAMLRHHDGALWAGDERIDLIHLSLSKVLDGSGPPAQVLEAIASGAARLPYGFSRAFCAHYKATFEVLSDPEHEGMFDVETRRILQTHVPWTRVLHPRKTTFHGAEVDLVELITKERERFVIKPSGAFGGAGVVLGWEATEARWAQAMKIARGMQCVVQERVDLGPSDIYYELAQGGELTHRTFTADLNPLIWNGDHADGAVSRIASSGLHNAAGGGSITSIWILDEN
ncbi:MAG TPA: hypothetical protein VGM39_25275, partial [Kofleriaceae bacterium]